MLGLSKLPKAEKGGELPQAWPKLGLGNGHLEALNGQNEIGI